MIRAFIALTLSSEDKVWLSQWPAKLKEQDRFGSINWVGADNLHLTLTFLGDIPEQVIEPLGHSLAASLAATAPLSLNVYEVGYAQFTQHQKFVVASVEATEPLVRLQKKVYHAARQAGLSLPKRAFKPHVTLGRVRGGGRQSGNLLIPTMSHHHLMSSNCVRVYQSELSMSGANYTPLVDIDLSDLPAYKQR